MLRLGAVDYVLKDRMARLPSAVQGALEYAAEHRARAEAEDQAARQRGAYRRIVETANDGIMLVDADFRITFYNRRLADMFGYDDQELIGTAPGAWHESEDSPLVNQHFHAIRSGRSREFEGRVLRKDGTSLWVRVSASPIRSGDDNYDGFLAMVSDISGLKEAEHRLKNAVAGTVAAMGALVETRDPYTAGHERRVAELSSAIARRMGLGEEAIEYLALTARMHDIGKIAVPAEILTKPSRLTPVEYTLIKQHPRGGRRDPLHHRLRLPGGRRGAWSTTSVWTARGTRGGCPATRSRWRAASWPSPTWWRPCRRTGRTGRLWGWSRRWPRSAGAPAGCTTRTWSRRARKVFEEEGFEFRE